MNRMKMEIYVPEDPMSGPEWVHCDGSDFPAYFDNYACADSTRVIDIPIYEGVVEQEYHLKGMDGQIVATLLVNVRYTTQVEEKASNGTG